MPYSPEDAEPDYLDYFGQGHALGAAFVQTFLGSSIVKLSVSSVSSVSSTTVCLPRLD
jgi:hypothetical protein